MSYFHFSRQEGCALTVRSLRMLQLDQNSIEAFVNLHKNTPLKKQVPDPLLL